MIFYITCAPPVEFCEVDPMQTESLACTIVESSPPDPCICAQQMVCRLSMRSLNRSGCARARADDSGIQGARGGARVTCILALLAFWRRPCWALPKKRNGQSTSGDPRHMGGARQAARCPYDAAEPSWALHSALTVLQ